jgi:hypothetical protein
MLGFVASGHPRGTGTSWSAVTDTSWSEPPGEWGTFLPLPLRACIDRCIDKSVGLESALVESRIESGTLHGGLALTHGS